MGSRIDSSGPTVFRGSRRQRRIYAPNLYGLEVFGTAFAEPGGCFKKDLDDLLPALTDEHSGVQETIAVQRHDPTPPVAVQAPPEPIDEIDALYAPHFRRLELELEANKARPPVHVPPFVSAGRVPQMSLELVDAAGAAVPVLTTVLEEHVPANQAK